MNGLRAGGRNGFRVGGRTSGPLTVVDEAVGVLCKVNGSKLNVCVVVVVFVKAAMALTAKAPLTPNAAAAARTVSREE